MKKRKRRERRQTRKVKEERREKRRIEEERKRRRVRKREKETTSVSDILSRTDLFTVFCQNCFVSLRDDTISFPETY